MENFTIESRCLKFCNKFRAVIFQDQIIKNFMCPLIERLDRVFVSKHAAEPLKHSYWKGI